MKSRVFKLAPVVTGVLLGLALSSGAALAKGDDDNLQKLGAFKTTGAPAMKTVEQNTKYAENLRKMLKNITLPDGFSIELFAVVPDARQMAVSPRALTSASRSIARRREMVCAMESSPLPPNHSTSSTFLSPALASASRSATSPRRETSFPPRRRKTRKITACFRRGR